MNTPLKKGKTQKYRKKPKSLPLCRLREIRDAQGKSIVELSEEAGVHRSIIIRIENGAQEGSTSIHLKLLAALGVSADEYFGFISSKPLSEDTPEILDSRKGFTVELFPSIPGAGTVKRIQLASGVSSLLKRYLDTQKPAFLYVAQGDIAFQRNKEVHKQSAGDAMLFPRANNLSAKNISSLPGILLLFQA